KKPAEVAWRPHAAVTFRTAGRHFGQMVFSLACLPFEAYFSLDAIVRTHVRLFITHRRMLEWNPSHYVKRNPDATADPDGPQGLRASYRVMWIGPATAIAAFAGI